MRHINGQNGPVGCLLDDTSAPRGPALAGHLLGWWRLRRSGLAIWTLPAPKKFYGSLRLICLGPLRQWDSVCAAVPGRCFAHMCPEHSGGQPARQPS